MKKYLMVRLSLSIFSLIIFSPLANAKGSHHGSHCGHGSGASSVTQTEPTQTEETQSASPLEFVSTTTLGKNIVLIFNEKPAMDTDQATVCYEEGMTLVAASLWMPAHGHGSAPVSVAPAKDRPTCALIENIFLPMSGDWEVRVEFADGDKGVFHVAI